MLRPTCQPVLPELCLFVSLRLARQPLQYSFRSGQSLQLQLQFSCSHKPSDIEWEWVPKNQAVQFSINHRQQARREPNKRKEKRKKYMHVSYCEEKSREEKHKFCSTTTPIEAFFSLFRTHFFFIIYFGGHKKSCHCTTLTLGTLSKRGIELKLERGTEWPDRRLSTGLNYHWHWHWL